MGTKVFTADETSDCTYCGKQDVKVKYYYPHEAGGYCIFAPRNKIDKACLECSHKKCFLCGEIQPRYAYIDCKQCGNIHCYNNTDMKYENNPALKHIVLCDAIISCNGG